MKTLITILALSISVTLFGQDSPFNRFEKTPNGYKIQCVITENGDTIPNIILNYVYIVDEMVFETRKQKHQWTRLKRDVAIVYPYSKLANKKLSFYNDQMAGKSKSEQKDLLKKAEKEIVAEFKDDVGKMSLNQGRILIKLIDRQTGNTSYELVKDLRGGFQAFFWQSVASLFKTNLKESFDPNANKEDKMIEQIVNSIDDGSFVN
jgi:hypothetical protein